MKIILLYILLFITAAASAQKKPKTIQLDTIHIRGYIYDEFGKPIKGMLISTKGPNVKIPGGYHLDDYDYYTATDVWGFFMLKGARFNDTLKLGSSSVYNTLIPVYNKGSRYLIIVLSHRKAEKIDSAQIIQISATRTQPKKKAQLNLVQDNPPPTCAYPIFDVRAHPKKGLKKFADTIASHITYPQKAIDNNIEGEVKIGFVIEKDGSIVRTRILQGIGYGCDEEVMNAILKSPKWVPSIENGMPSTAAEVITIDFELTDK